MKPTVSIVFACLVGLIPPLAGADPVSEDCSVLLPPRLVVGPKYYEECDSTCSYHDSTLARHFLRGADAKKRFSQGKLAHFWTAEPFPIKVKILLRCYRRPFCHLPGLYPDTIHTSPGSTLLDGLEVVIRDEDEDREIVSLEASQLADPEKSQSPELPEKLTCPISTFLEIMGNAQDEIHGGMQTGRLYSAALIIRDDFFEKFTPRPVQPPGMNNPVVFFIIEEPRTQSDWARVWAERCYRYSSEHRYADAESAADLSIKLDPDGLSPLFCLFGMYHEQRDYEKLVEVFGPLVEDRLSLWGDIRSAVEGARRRLDRKKTPP